MAGKNYQILELVATGGTAVLYRAVQTSLDRVVAIKKLHQHLTTDENFTRRFILEAKAAASLDHENIVKIIDFGVEDGTYMMVMEYIEGESLRDVLEKWRQIPPNLALAIAHQICLGLEHAHSKGIVHRDIKPGNVMLTRTGKIKITDFGLAKLAQAQTQHTAANSILGTPLYMSPEQAFGESVDQRSDLFSLGTVLYECLTGRQPFHDESYMGVIQNIIHQNPTQPSKLGVDLPVTVESIVARSMHKNRENRFQSAREFRQAIEKHLGLDVLKQATDGLKSLLATDGATMVLPRTEQARRQKGRVRRSLAVAFTVGAVAMLAATAYFAMPGALRARIANTIVRGWFPAPDSRVENSAPQGKVLAAATAGVFPGTALADSASVRAAAPSDSASLPNAATPSDSLEAARTADTSPSEAETRHAEARTGWLSVTSDPTSEIYVDGTYVGDTPVARIELESGRHSFECQSPKYETYREIVNITTGELSYRNIVLQKLTGRISLSATEGAEVYLDGILVGGTPLAGPIETETGTHQLTIKKAGYHVWNNTVTVEAKQLLPLKITLSPIY